ncbi:DoxX family protein [Salinimicrobium sediminilitoris]|uniref:DoxX family protein n=1 Tax=Salinimicrobium sediminilitoris TaxID=2876715 RepID=UPI001E421CC8|nr:DoxX family protein [Salinimicrobium sediminilitoris]MCC8359540.1 DoxX family protein [Salinimicrobium sediminilitoris]
MDNFISNIPVYLILVFTIITFLQSGLDKMMNWKGNYEWLTGHFKGTFMGGMVSLLLGIILVLEIITGLMALAAIYTLYANEDPTLALRSLVLAAVTLLMLLFGQRVANDYAGAFTIVGYFIVIIFGVFLVTA